MKQLVRVLCIGFFIILMVSCERFQISGVKAQKQSLKKPGITEARDSSRWSNEHTLRVVIPLMRSNAAE